MGRRATRGCRQRSTASNRALILEPNHTPASSLSMRSKIIVFSPMRGAEAKRPFPPGCRFIAVVILLFCRYFFPSRRDITPLRFRSTVFDMTACELYAIALYSRYAYEQLRQRRRDYAGAHFLIRAAFTPQRQRYFDDATRDQTPRQRAPPRRCPRPPWRLRPRRYQFAYDTLRAMMSPRALLSAFSLFIRFRCRLFSVYACRLLRRQVPTTPSVTRHLFYIATLSPFIMLLHTVPLSRLPSRRQPSPATIITVHYSPPFSPHVSCRAAARDGSNGRRKHIDEICYVPPKQFHAIAITPVSHAISCRSSSSADSITLLILLFLVFV